MSPLDTKAADCRAALNRYLAELDRIYRSGSATEHSYRPALKTLVEKITTGLVIINEPKHIACGAPDYIITRNKIPVGYIEAKDVSVGLHHKANKAQFDRYKHALGNLIITDYLSFELFVEGELVASVTLANVTGNAVSPDKKQYTVFLELIERFTKYSGSTIYNSEQLAKLMADKAKLLAAIMRKALNVPAENDTLLGQYEGFKKVLLHELGAAEFADIYAQTLAYGLFAARLNQRDEAPFTRYLAPYLIPQSNPFLRKFFNYIAGIELDDRITWIVDALADLFNCVAVDEIKKEFSKADMDPYIHFYETFLAAYDPALRETRGVYYTPIPVVKFIVQAVDDVLKTEFNLRNGLANHSQIPHVIRGKDGVAQTVELHRVQILDPAAGTGTFLAEVVSRVFSYFEKSKGAWTGYCKSHLIPRLHGFEILMAPYAMAHFKLDMKLKETGYTFMDDSRLRVFLTNSLEEPPEEVPELFMERWLTAEAEEANKVKRDTPVMIVLGNPPYNVSSQNRGEWIHKLMGDYKKEPGTAENLHERKLNLDDDYVKFLRFGQMMVIKNGSGILAYINNHSFLDNPTFRGMRWHLLKTFDTISILDLHGNVKKKETAPDGGKDENVFDIQQGVSINIFVKTGKKKDGALAQVFHHDLYGAREAKYQFLLENTLESIAWKELKPEEPFYFFVPKNFDNQKEYEEGFSVKELFPLYNAGVKTDRDSLFIDMNRQILENRITTLLSGDLSVDFKERYRVNDSGSYKLTVMIKNKVFAKEHIRTIQYRPFDYRYIYYEPGLTSRPAYSVMRHFLDHENTGLIVLRNMPAFRQWSGVFISSRMIEFGIGGSFPGNSAPLFPLYLYPAPDDLDKTAKRRPNLTMSIVETIAARTGLRFTGEKEDAEDAFAPIDILDYVYAVLHSPRYRNAYREFIKIDFPRVPYPSSAAQFRALAALGATLRALHLLEAAPSHGTAGEYPVAGSNTVAKPEYRDGKVWINATQYFADVPQDVWEFYIGGYQPAQKWLKDRKDRTLDYDAIEHYQKIIAALTATIAVQRLIDEALETP
ncbi:MAG: DNA methyltransferase [Treponema sp.]|jgi:predicted helicase|nr:DNA methyltransferase [Treponema sp.]